MCALFITLTLDATRNREQVTSLVLAGIAFLAASALTPNAALFTGLLMFVGTLVIRFLWKVKK